MAMQDLRGDGGRCQPMSPPQANGLRMRGIHAAPAPRPGLTVTASGRSTGPHRSGPVVLNRMPGHPAPAVQVAGEHVQLDQRGRVVRGDAAVHPRPPASATPGKGCPAGAAAPAARTPDGTVLWLAGRYRSEVYALNATTGQLLRRIPVGTQPHGLCVYPQPGRYSLGHTGVFR